MTRQEARREARACKGLCRFFGSRAQRVQAWCIVNIQEGQGVAQVMEERAADLHNLDHRAPWAPIRSAATARRFKFRTPSTQRVCVRRALRSFPAVGDYGVGGDSQEAASRAACEQELERSVRREGQVVLGWRDVPVCEGMTMVQPWKASARHPPDLIGRGPDASRPRSSASYVIRRAPSRRIQALKLRAAPEYFVPSMSTRTQSSTRAE